MLASTASAVVAPKFEDVLVVFIVRLGLGGDLASFPTSEREAEMNA